MFQVSNKSGIENEVFFKPFKSTTDFCIRTGSLLTAPVILGITSAYFLVNALIEFLKAIVNACLFRAGDATVNIKVSFHNLFASTISLILAVASPFVELIDLIGSAFTSSATNTVKRPSNNSFFGTRNEPRYETTDLLDYPEECASTVRC
jgi:hypothetical protein